MDPPRQRPPARHGRRSMNSSLRQAKEQHNRRDARSYGLEKAGASSISEQVKRLNQPTDDHEELLVSITSHRDYEYDEGGGAPPRQARAQFAYSSRNHTNNDDQYRYNSRFPPPGEGLPRKSGAGAGAGKRPRNGGFSDNRLRDARERQSMQAPAVKPSRQVVKKKQAPTNARQTLFTELLDRNKNIHEEQEVQVVEQPKQNMESLEEKIPRKKKQRTNSPETPPPPPQQYTGKASCSSRKAQHDSTEDDDEEEEMLPTKPYPKYKRKKKSISQEDGHVKIADSDDEGAKKVVEGQDTRDYVEMLEERPAPPKLRATPTKGMFSQMSSIAKNAAASVKNVASDFMSSGLKTRSRTNSNDRKKKKSKGKPIIPGNSLEQGQRQLTDSWGSSTDSARRNPGRSAKKEKKDPEHIVIDSSDDDSDGEPSAEAEVVVEVSQTTRNHLRDRPAERLLTPFSKIT
eukprot:scaffold1511_cov170-Amphora_coffeaeformis.AAC.2